MINYYLKIQAYIHHRYLLPLVSLNKITFYIYLYFLFANKYLMSSEKSETTDPKLRNGPIVERECIDIFCLLLFVVFTIGSFHIWLCNKKW